MLALQGAFARHQQILGSLGVAHRAVRRPDQLDECDALVLPGGESTTMSMLLERSGLFDVVAARLDDGMAVLGTCAGAILLASEVLDGRDDQRRFDAIDVSVRRNGYGRQVDSFETTLTLDDDPQAFPAVFIRAPVIERVGAGVVVSARHEGRPVLCEQGAVVIATFHPELADDDRLHRRFLDRLG